MEFTEFQLPCSTLEDEPPPPEFQLPSGFYRVMEDELYRIILGAPPEMTTYPPVRRCWCQCIHICGNVS